MNRLGRMLHYQASGDVPPARLTWVLPAAVWMSLVPTKDAQPERPNIGFMLSNDQDWNGLSVQMHPDCTPDATEPRRGGGKHRSNK